VATAPASTLAQLLAMNRGSADTDSAFSQLFALWQAGRRVPADVATASVTIKLDNAFRLLMLAAGDFSSPGVEISGDQAVLQQFLGVIERPDPSFNIITP